MVLTRTCRSDILSSKLRSMLSVLKGKVGDCERSFAKENQRQNLLLERWRGNGCCTMTGLGRQDGLQT